MYSIQFRNAGLRHSEFCVKDAATMNPQLDKEIMSLRIIIAAMMMGIVAFGAVVLAIGSKVAQDDAELGGMLLAVLGVLAVGELIAYAVLRMATLSSARRQFEQEPTGEDAEVRMMPAWRTLILVRSAMAEGLGLFGLVIVLVTATRTAFVAPVIALIILAAGFPTKDKLAQLTASITGQNPFAR